MKPDTRLIGVLSKDSLLGIVERAYRAVKDFGGAMVAVEEDDVFAINHASRHARTRTDGIVGVWTAPASPYRGRAQALKMEIVESLAEVIRERCA